MEYNENCWLLPMALNKVRKEKNELRDSNSLFKQCIKDLKASMSAHRVEIAENKTQNLIL